MTLFLSAAEYPAYIKSKKWARKKQEYWTSGRSTNCYICDRPRNASFHMHHKTYDRLGAEHLDDLSPVCRACHTAIHKFYDNCEISLWDATES